MDGNGPSFDFLPECDDLDAVSHSNQSNNADIKKKYLVYMELPKVLIGDYKKSSCVSGNLIRFHFLLRMPSDEENTVLCLLPIKFYKVPVVNIAVIHRPFLEDDSAKGPIPKSPDVHSPLIKYQDEDVENNKLPKNQTLQEVSKSIGTDNLEASGSSEDSYQQKNIKNSQVSLKNPHQEQIDQGRSSQERERDHQEQSGQEQISQSDIDKAQIKSEQSDQRRPGHSSRDSDEQKPSSETGLKSPSPRKSSATFLEVGTQSIRNDLSAGILSDDVTTAQTVNTDRPKQRQPKKYFVYCELPKVLLNDYRKSSVVCSEIIHTHFLIKIARDEDNEQPVLRPIKRYHRPRVNFAVIHKSLLVDDEAIGPIPRSLNTRSPMVRKDKSIDEDDAMMHATMGFCYGRLPRSKYELTTHWSLVRDDSGGSLRPELVLSKAEA